MRSDDEAALLRKANRYGRRGRSGAYPIRCVGERIKVTGVPEFREVAWRA
ncbi:MAG: hypothetical protein H0A75_04955 [Candidatus Methanofishera endochildressiae]|uniref:Uncharacterized protein n=1 Tax=Candidatus Methanofishera endochildressiae TaxID=2738884 RepID=A0A7Z0MNP0_9GAMM|nr:hypothetical protein [Candidatus Methanofishera endochildressiae]